MKTGAAHGYSRPNRRKKRIAAVIWIVGAAVYLVCEAVATVRLRGYSYVDDYISDLGVAPVMSVGGFILHGCLFLAGAMVFCGSCPKLGWAGWGFAMMAAANALGNVIVGTVRIGAVHATGAAMAILGGNIAVIMAGVGSRRIGAPSIYRRASVAIGAIGIACLLTLVIDGANGSRDLPVGIMERGAVYSIVGWEIMTGAAILCRRPTTAADA
ncbi:MAG: DUF998 domain-containing protein [Mycobacterium sp.]